MPLQDLSYFTPGTGFPTNEQSSPWIGAVNALNKIREAQLANVGTAQINQFRPGLLQNQTLQGQLENQKAEKLMPFVTPQAQADLEKTQLGNTWMPIQRIVEAQNAITNAGRLQNSRSRFGTYAYQIKSLLGSMTKEQAAAWQAGHQLEMKAALQDQIAAAKEAQNSPIQANALQNIDLNAMIQRAMGGQRLPMMNTGTPVSQPQTQAQQAVSGIPSPQTPMNIQQGNNITPTANPPGTTSIASSLPNATQEETNFFNKNDPTEPTEPFERASINGEMRTSLDPIAQKRFDASLTMDNLLASPQIQNAINIASNMTEGDYYKGLAEYKLGIPNQQFADYMAAIQQLSPAFSGSLKILEGFGATNQGYKVGKEFIDLGQRPWLANPSYLKEIYQQGKNVTTAEKNALAQTAYDKLKDPRILSMYGMVKIPDKFPNERSKKLWLSKLSKKQKAYAASVLAARGK